MLRHLAVLKFRWNIYYTPQNQRNTSWTTSIFLRNCSGLRLRFGFDDKVCTFCKNDVESTNQIFSSCVVIHPFWFYIHKWMKQRISPFPSSFSRDYITFGKTLQNKNEEFCYDVILSLVKFFIHKNRALKSSPKCTVNLNEFKLCLKSYKLLKEYKHKN